MIDRYLRHPPRMPDYRRDRPHSDFVANIAIAADRLKELLTNAWEAHDAVSHWPHDIVERLLTEKYGQDEWRQRR
jgi:lipoate-protein ligase A